MRRSQWPDFGTQPQLLSGVQGSDRRALMHVGNAPHNDCYVKYVSIADLIPTGGKEVPNDTVFEQQTPFGR